MQALLFRASWDLYTLLLVLFLMAAITCVIAAVANASDGLATSAGVFAALAAGMHALRDTEAAEIARRSDVLLNHISTVGNRAVERLETLSNDPSAWILSARDLARCLELVKQIEDRACREIASSLLDDWRVRVFKIFHSISKLYDDEFFAGPITDPDWEPDDRDDPNSDAYAHDHHIGERVLYMLFKFSRIGRDFHQQTDKYTGTFSDADLIEVEIECPPLKKYIERVRGWDTANPFIQISRKTSETRDAPRR